MSKVKFQIPSYERASYSVFDIIKERKKEYRKNIFVELPEKLVQEIIEKDNAEIKEKLVEELKKKHNIEKLEKYKRELEKYWKPLNKLFFENLEKITGFKVKHEEYIVYITEIIRGMYTYKNEVFTNLKEDIKRSGYIAAEEILHLHYWDIFRKTIKNIKAPWRINKEIWQISEVIPEYVLTDSLFEKFGWGKDLNRKYPFIREVKEKLDPFWQGKKDFKDFMLKVHKNLIPKINKKTL